MTEPATLEPLEPRPPGPADSYTVAEAARVIGRTPQRVRQMLSEGKMHAIPNTHPLRIPAEEVHTSRAAARRTNTHRSGPKPDGLSLEEVMALVERLTTRALAASNEQMTAAQAARDRAEEILRESLAEERARRERAEEEATALRERLAEAEALTGKGWRKGKGKKSHRK